MSRTIRALAITGAAATLSLGLAIPASADDFAGQYTLTLDQESATWTVRPCEDADPAAGFVQCVHVAQSGGKEVPWESVATWAVGYWTLRVQRPDVIGDAVPRRFALLRPQIAHVHEVRRRPPDRLGHGRVIGRGVAVAGEDRADHVGVALAPRIGPCRSFRPAGA